MLHMTAKQLRHTHVTKLKELIDFAGGVPHLALMLDVNQITIHAWRRRGRISKKGAISVENNDAFNGKFTARDLRPELNNTTI